MKIDFEAFILAGGKSSRFGSNKALVKLNEETLLEIILGKLRQIFPKVTIVVKDSAQVTTLKIDHIVDNHQYPGALAGIATALSTAKAQKIFIVSCDQPLIDHKVIDKILQNAGDEELLLPVVDGFKQPLQALYDKKAYLKLPGDLNAALPDFTCKLITRQMLRGEFCGIPNFEKSFVNVNTQSDFERVKRIWRNL
ncbi:MAG: molybdenum cofactor guanylyltransferase [Pseudomonadota bacterium]